KVRTWDLNARDHILRLQELEDCQAKILSSPWPLANKPSTTDSRPLLELSPRREGSVARAVRRRTKIATALAAAMESALGELDVRQGACLAERARALRFLRVTSPGLAFAPWRDAWGQRSGAVGGGMGDDDDSNGGGGHREIQTEVVTSSAMGGAEAGPGGERGGRGKSGGEVTLTAGLKTWWESHEERLPGSAMPLHDWQQQRRGDGQGQGQGQGGVCPLPVADLEWCLGALREVVAMAGRRDRLGAALEALRDHVKATLIDLMDLETSIPEDRGGGGGSGGGGGESEAFTVEDSRVLDAKVTSLLGRLGGDGGGGVSGAVGRRGVRGVVGGGAGSLASVYHEVLSLGAEEAEVEAEAAEDLVARALGATLEIVGGKFLGAVDDTYQRLSAAATHLRISLGEVRALAGGTTSSSGSSSSGGRSGGDEDTTRSGGEEQEARGARSLAQERRSRLVALRQQLLDDEDRLEELQSKLRRRRRQAAGGEEIRGIEADQRHVRARLEALKGMKLAELRGIRSSQSYLCFPELLLDHPDPAESAFYPLANLGLVIRDPDEWVDGHMQAVAGAPPPDAAAMGTLGAGGEGGGRSDNPGRGLEGCRLAEVDNLSVVVKEVECGTPERERALLTELYSLASLLPRDCGGATVATAGLSPDMADREGRGGGGSRNSPTGPDTITVASPSTTPELAPILGVSLRQGRAYLEVPLEGATTGAVWLQGGSHPTPIARPGVSSPGRQPWEVWVVMCQVLQALVALHEAGVVHGAVCLGNILVASGSGPPPAATVAAVANSAARMMTSPFSDSLGVVGHRAGGAGGAWEWGGHTASEGAPPSFRRAQLCLPFPVAMARAPSECLPPEVVRGEAWTAAGDMYAFGVMLWGAL
ncbi:unnamed protein product, partial [Discosporangium mesarthrocarpum]